MCDWRALQAQLAASPWLDASDDLSTQRGIVAASIAVLDRMSNGEGLRKVSWTTGRTLAKADAKLAWLMDVVPVPPAASPSGNPSQKVDAPLPPPRKPFPGGAAVAQPEPRVVEQEAAWF